MKIDSGDWVLIAALALLAVIIACAGLPDIIAAFRGGQ